MPAASHQLEIGYCLGEYKKMRRCCQFKGLGIGSVHSCRSASVGSSLAARRWAPEARFPPPRSDDVGVGGGQAARSPRNPTVPGVGLIAQARVIRQILAHIGRRNPGIFCRTGLPGLRIKTASRVDVSSWIGSE